MPLIHHNAVKEFFIELTKFRRRIDKEKNLKILEEEAIIFNDKLREFHTHVENSYFFLKNEEGLIAQLKKLLVQQVKERGEKKILLDALSVVEGSLFQNLKKDVLTVELLLQELLGSLTELGRYIGTLSRHGLNEELRDKLSYSATLVSADISVAHAAFLNIARTLKKVNETVLGDAQLFAMFGEKYAHFTENIKSWIRDEESLFEGWNPSVTLKEIS